jgi:guanosine-3',5'-bis(diphosphate) 3'-pyrophosphohydrolase
LNVVTLLAAVEFAADKHRHQRRKDAEGSPYMNHLIAVTRILAAEGGIDNEAALLAAVLHDTVEDTDTTFEELDARFGAMVATLVREMTDDKTLAKDVRKQRQIDHAPSASPLAKQLKIADKIANIRDIVFTPPADWSRDRKLKYFTWAEQVVAGCRGINAGLERAFEEAIAMGRAREDFATFVAGSSWRFAKTYVDSYPHEYTLIQVGDTDGFQMAITCIERWGVVERFWNSRRRYLYVDGRKYWHMGKPESQKPDERPTLINRSWSDVGRYSDEARALGYDGEQLKELVEHWKLKLDEAKGTSEKDGCRPAHTLRPMGGATYVVGIDTKGR